jgi:hypothetical protein
VCVESKGKSVWSQSVELLLARWGLVSSRFPCSFHHCRPGLTASTSAAECTSNNISSTLFGVSILLMQRNSPSPLIPGVSLLRPSLQPWPYPGMVKASQSISLLAAPSLFPWPLPFCTVIQLSKFSFDEMISQAPELFFNMTESVAKRTATTAKV